MYNADFATQTSRSKVELSEQRTYNRRLLSLYMLFRRMVLQKLFRFGRTIFPPKICSNGKLLLTGE